MIAEELSDFPGVAEKWLQCNGRQLRKLAQAGLAWLEKNYQHVNALNVFPVPDGDTGTNMLLTMQSAYGRIQDRDEMDVSKVAHELAHGALMGARGNSGVILSQIWRGLARGLQDKKTFNALELAEALNLAAETAYKGVMRPVEGTILTVIKDGAAEARDAAVKNKDLRWVLSRVLERCQHTLERTPEMLPILRQAGVVDSGGQGLVYLLEGMLRYVNGGIGDEIGAAPAAAATPTLSAQALAAPAEGLEFPYDVQFIVAGEGLNVFEARRAIDAMGDSTVVVGDEKTIKVHVHVKNPGQPLTYGASLGRLTDVVVENMQLQMEALISGQRSAVSGQLLAVSGLESAEANGAAVQPGQIGIVAVASGEGLARIFRSLNADAIVNGGQSNNPSTEEIFQAIQNVGTDKIIVLPNNKNIILAAEAARTLSPKQVVVIPTRTVPQGISAICHLVRDGDMEAVVSAMSAALDDVASGEITRATRSVTLDGVEVKAGEMIGLANGRLCASGKDLPAVLSQTLATMAVEERELVSIYYGGEVNEDEAKVAADMVQNLYPNVEVEVLSGGQAHYMYILGAE